MEKYSTITHSPQRIFPQNIRLALSQLQALGQLKYQLFLNQWHSNSRFYKMGLFLLIGILASVAILTGIGIYYLVCMVFSSHSLLEGEYTNYFPLIFLGMLFAISFIWIFFPMLLIMQNEGLDFRKLLVFPVSKRQLHTFNILLGMIDPWAVFFYPLFVGLILAGVISLGFWSLAWILITIFLYIVVNVTWGRFFIELVFAIFDSRHLREIFLLGMIVITLLLALLPAFWAGGLEAVTVQKNIMDRYLLSESGLLQISLPLNILLTLSPPGMAATSIADIYSHHWASYIETNMGLFLWLSLGNLLGTHLQERIYRVSSQKKTLNYTVKEQPSIFFYRWFSPDIWAMAYKESRYLMRSVMGKLIFFLSPILLIVFRILAIQEESDIYGASSLLTGVTGYIFMTSLFLFSNIFGWDGHGFKNYLLTPIRAESILAGKNLAFAIFVSAEFLLILYLYLAIFDIPSWSDLLFVCMIFVTLLFGVLSLGNLISIRFPSYVDLINSRYKQKTLPVFLTFGIFSVILLSSLLSLTISFFSREPAWLVAAAFMMMAIGTYRFLFPFTARLFENQSRSILEKVTKNA